MAVPFVPFVMSSCHNQICSTSYSGPSGDSSLGPGQEWLSTSKNHELGTENHVLQTQSRAQTQSSDIKAQKCQQRSRVNEI